MSTSSEMFSTLLSIAIQLLPNQQHYNTHILNSFPYHQAGDGYFRTQILKKKKSKKTQKH